MSAWNPIETAPRDGSMFIAARFEDGKPEMVEAGCYLPLYWNRYEPAGEGLFREVKELLHEWQHFNNFHSMTHWMPMPPLVPAIPCWCEQCGNHNGLLGRTRMILCPTCGDKRCPRANNHRNECTGSNEPGQPGSSCPAFNPLAHEQSR